eukprot:c45879_g1_i1 orf=101-268(+)
METHTHMNLLVLNLSYLNTGFVLLNPDENYHFFFLFLLRPGYLEQPPGATLITSP